MEERRRLHRLEVSIPCQFQGPRSIHEGRISNVSSEGAYVLADICPHPGALLKVFFEPEPGRRIEIAVQVVHRGFFEESEDQVEGFGVHFKEFEGESRRHFEQFVHSVTGSA